MLLKLYAWKGHKEPISDGSKLEIEITDKETGEFKVKGADIAVFIDGMFVIPEEDNKTITEEGAPND